MNDLIKRVKRFQSEVFPEKSELFQELAHGQNPEWLFITCSDSRIDPCLLTQTHPGELFICRNAGNIVPPYGNFAGGVSATIEYAVMVLKVKHIIVCGHSDCGAMKGVLFPEQVAHLKAVSHWLHHGDAARLVTLSHSQHTSDQELLLDITEQNVVAQIANLKTHPCVAAGLHHGTLDIHGWVYDIQSGNVSCYDDSTKAFACISAQSQLEPVRIST